MKKTSTIDTEFFLQNEIVNFNCQNRMKNYSDFYAKRKMNETSQLLLQYFFFKTLKERKNFLF